jgi:hypothetical protein
LTQKSFNIRFIIENILNKVIQMHKDKIPESWDELNKKRVHQIATSKGVHHDEKSTS